MQEPQSTSNSQLSELSSLKPLDFVNYINENYPKLFSITTPQTIFNPKLRNSKSYLKHPLFQLSQKKQILASISKRKVPITSCCVKNDHLFLGDSDGNIYMYLYKSEINKQQFKSPEPRTDSNLAIKHMDISEDGLYLLAGYANGDIDLWEINTKKYLYTVKSVHHSEITSIKFLSVTSNKQFDFISCDIDCNCYKVNISSFFFTYKHSYTPIETNTLNPFYAMELYQLSLEKTTKNVGNNLWNMDNFVNNVTNLVNVVSGVNVNVKLVYICVLCSLDNVFVFYIDNNEITKIGDLQKPDFVNYNNICPDIAIGEGEVPDGAVMNNLFGIKETTPKKCTKQKKESLMLAISWGNIIYFYSIDIKEILKGGTVKLNQTPCGHYNNKATINRIGFLSSSLLFIIDQETNNNLTIIHTSQIPPDEFKKHAKHLYKRAITEQTTLLDNNIYANKIADKVTGNVYYSYKEFILYDNKCIFFISENKIYGGELTTYVKYVNLLNDNLDWESSLRLAVDLYNGKIHSFPDIPANDKERQDNLKQFMEDLIKYYIDNILHKIQNNGEQQDKELINSMTNAIDYCLQIENGDFIFSNLLSIYDKKGFTDKFVKALEPFIFNNKFKDIYLSEQSTLSLFMAYFTRKENSLLIHLATHINEKSLNTPLIKNMCFKFNLFQILCYIFNNNTNTNNNNDEILNLIENMFNYLSKKTSNKTNEIFSYYNMFVNKGLTYIEDTFEYVGHYLLWYINLLITKHTLFNNDLFIKIYIWLLSQKVFPVLVCFDSYSLFQLIEKILIQDEIKNSIINYDKTQIEEITKKYQPIKLDGEHPFNKFTDISETVNYIISITKQNTSFYGITDMFMFLIRISIHDTTIVNKENIMHAIISVLSPHREIRKHSYEDLYDKFAYHGIQLKQNTTESNTSDTTSIKLIQLESIDEKYIEEISSNIIQLIKSDYNLDENEISKLIKVCDYPAFILIKINLLDKNHRYLECLDLFIKNANTIKSEKIFKWIDELLLSLKQQHNTIDLNNFNNKLILQIENLANIDKPKLKTIINKWYTTSQKVLIIQQLTNNPQLQLEFIGMILNDLNSKDSLYLINQQSNLDIKEIQKILMLQLNLLVNLGMHSEIFPSIKKNSQYYPLIECIEFCIEHQIYDACMYLYKITDQHEKALQIAMKDMDNKYEKLINSQNQDDLITQNIECFNEIFISCVKICEDCSDTIFQINDEVNYNNTNTDNDNNEKTSPTNNNEDKSIWFTLLDKIYIYHSETHKYTNKEVHEYMSQILNKFLEKMCLYVQIRLVINEMASKHKEIEIKEFKQILNKILCSFRTLTSILTSVKKTRGTFLYISVFDYMKQNRQGKEFTTKLCSYCNKRIDYVHETNDHILLFNCGHILHSKCSKKLLLYDKIPICFTCKQTEIDESVKNDYISNDDYNKMTYFKKKIKRKWNNEQSYQGLINKTEEEIERVHKEEEKKMRLKSLKDFDRKYLEQSSMLDDIL